jgi:hypothetical protein
MDSRRHKLVNKNNSVHKSEILLFRNMQSLSSHLVAIIEDLIQAGIRNVEIRVKEELQQDLLTIEIIDNGGLDEKTERQISYKLSLFAEAARMSDGHLTIGSDSEKRTKITATFQYTHVARKPMGDLCSQLQKLIIEHSNVNFVYSHIKNELKFNLDTKKLKAQLRNQPINSSAGQKIVEDKLNSLKILLNDQFECNSS